MFSLRKKSQMTLWVILLTGLLVVLMGSFASSAKKVVTIDFSGMVNEDVYLWQQINEYNRTHPNVMIVGVEGISRDALAIQAKSKTAEIEAFMATPFIDGAKFVAQGILQPWDKWLSDEEIKDILPPCIDEGMIDGKMYAYGGMVDVTALAYRKSMFKAIGADTPAETWDEFYDQVVKIENAFSKPGKRVWGTAFNLGWGIWRDFQPVMGTLTKKPFGADGYINWDSPGAVQALELLKKFNAHMAPDVWVEPNEETLFKTGLAASLAKYVPSAIRIAKVFGREDLGVVPLPHGPDAKGSIFWSTPFVLTKYGENTKEAVDFIVWLVHQPATWDSQSLMAGKAPPFYSEYKRLIAKSPEDAEWLKASREALAETVAIPPRPFYLIQNDVLKPLRADYIRGKTTMTASEVMKLAKKLFYEAVAKQEK